MKNQFVIDFLQSSNLLNKVQSEEIASIFCPIKLDRNDFFLKEGQVSNQYLLLSSGYIRSYAYNTDGVDVTTHFYSSGFPVFEVNSFFTQSPSQEYYQALTDCEGAYITYPQLNTLFHTVPEFREFGRKILVKGFSMLKSRMLSMITETAEQRYLRLMHQTPDVLQHAPLKHVATYLGVTDTSLSRIRKELAQKDIKR